MNKIVITVFIIAGTLGAVFIFWQLMFAVGQSDGRNAGILRAGYNSCATYVNQQYARLSGTGATILPKMELNVSHTSSIVHAGFADMSDSY